MLKNVILGPPQIGTFFIFAQPKVVKIRDLSLKKGDIDDIMDTITLILGMCMLSSFLFCM